MKLILFQLITNFTIGSIVYFDKNVHKIVDITMIHPFMKNKSSIFMSTWKKPLWFVVTLVNPHGGINIVGHNAIKDIYNAGYNYEQIVKAFKY
jgi:hypothetical protein